MKDNDLQEFTNLDLQRQIEVPAHLRQRWHDSIDAAARQELAEQQQPQRMTKMLSFFWGAAVTAALALGIGIGVFYAGGERADETADYALQELPAVGPDRATAFARVLQAHLRDTQQNIAAIPAGNDDERTLLVLQIVQQNRLFEKAAENNDADNLARVLRAFEPILLRLAATDIAPQDAGALRAQLAFELKVMLTKLERSSSNETQTT